MPNLHDLLQEYVFYQFPDAFVAFFLCAVAAMLAPVLVVEALALFRGLHQAGHWRWRDALALLPLLAGVGNLALVNIVWKLYLTLSTDFLGNVAVCRRYLRCTDMLLPPAVREASGEVEKLILPSLLWLLATYGLALASLVVLGSGRRRRTGRPLAA